ncbi:hypothetical protein PHYBOEH_000537 [Phytophthora boehmeriae]|uniref:Proline-rich protein PRCC n=1 Tax=Phytophthora boehmeriae TaxID=109152 RepID=A0A8T1WXL1_9STRA|nr:hypothetical protein PHYBOEH_000537 [Phytophthora boehmeriae]
MSLLVDYASSSEDEAAPSVPAPTVPAPPVSAPAAAPTTVEVAPSIASKTTSNAPQKLKKKKTKTTLFLPPEIQRLLETGTTGALSDDSDDDNELMAKHKRAKKAASKRPRPSAEEKDSVLSFLPPPKHELPVAEETAQIMPEEKVESQTEEAQAPAAEAATAQQAEENAAAWQQYYQQQQLHQINYAAGPDYYVGQGEEDVPGGSSKRRRTRERDIERALQQGHFESVAEQIADVQGPSPNAWQPPVDELARSSAGGSSEQDVKVKASFWNAQAGTRVASVKPSRLQRQKHQLNQLAFDAKLRDFELLDKRSASLKTKRETYAKYGW